jgi:hypothetical protein
MNFTVITREDLESVIREAARRGAEEALRAISKDRPAQVNYTEAGKLLGRSRQTVANMARAGTIKLNASGLVPITEIDRVLAAK